MAIPSSCSTLRLPAGFRNLLEGLALEVLRAQPDDVVAFAAQHFQRLLQEREGGSVDPVVWGAQLDAQLLTEPPYQESAEDKEKEDEGREEEGEDKKQERDAAPQPNQGALSPSQSPAPTDSL